MNSRPLVMIGVVTALALSACTGDKVIDPGTGTGTGTTDGGASDGGGTEDGGGTTAVGDDCGDDIASACDFAIDSSTGYAQADDKIDPAGDRDFFKMTLGQGQTIGVGTIAYAATGETTPDTVLRLYDSAGNLLATNDDMPYRIQETDSALYFQADSDGVYYLEVLEWSDWADGYDAAGGSAYDYSLIAYEPSQLDAEPENNEGPSMEKWLKTKGNYQYYGNFWSEDGTPAMMFGDMDEAGDVDIFPVTADTKDGSPLYCSYSAWPTWYPTLQPVFAMYNSSMDLVAYNDSPQFGVDRVSELGGFTYDEGLYFKMQSGDTYYMEVSDLAGASGVGTFYAALTQCFTFTDIVTVEDVDVDNNLPTQSTDILMTESSSTAGYYYGYVSGEFTVGANPADTLDAWRITAGTTGGSLDGKLLNVVVQAQTLGTMADTAITLYASDGSTVLATASGNSFDDSGDPAIENLTLDGAGAAVYIAIEAEGLSDTPEANQYYFDATVEEAK